MTKLSPEELRENLNLIPVWNQNFEVPDVIYFRDIPQNSAVFLDDAQRRIEVGLCDPLTEFFWPKGNGKLRRLSLASAHDLVVLRTLAGRIVARTDSLLLPEVLSNRLWRPPPGWRFRKANHAFRLLIQTATSHINDGYSLTRSDVENFYPTLSADRLEVNYPAWGCDPEAVASIGRFIRTWAPLGIPIGPEAFGVIGNAYLLPLDVRLAAIPDIRFLRWVDDVWIFSRNFTDREWAMSVFDHELDLLEVTRSIEKTKHADGRRESLELASDPTLASLSYCLDTSSDSEASEALCRAYDEELRDATNPVLRRFRFIVKALRFRGSGYAVEDLLKKPHLMNVDPIVASDYLMALGSHSQLREVFSFIERYVRDPADEFAGLVLHLLRAATSRRWGNAEAKLLLEVLDSPCPAPVRAWAAVVLARTPRWSKSLVKQRVLEERETIVRRGFFSTLKSVGTDEDLGPFLCHVRRFAPDLFPMSWWLVDEDAH